MKMCFSFIIIILLFFNVNSSSGRFECTTLTATAQSIYRYQTCAYDETVLHAALWSLSLLCKRVLQRTCIRNSLSTPPTFRPADSQAPPPLFVIFNTDEIKHTSTSFSPFHHNLSFSIIQNQVLSTLFFGRTSNNRLKFDLVKCVINI